MIKTFPGIPVLVWDTIRAPRQTAERIIALDLPVRSLWEALALGVLLTVIVVVGLMLGAPVDTTDPATAEIQQMYAQPIPVAIGQLLSSIMTVFAVYWVGRWFGGTGRLEGAVALIAWHQIFLLCVAVAGMLAGLLFPPLLSMLLIALVGLYFYVLTQFVCALHGFTNTAMVFVGIIAAFLAMLVAVAVVTGFIAALFVGGVSHV